MIAFDTQKTLFDQFSWLVYRRRHGSFTRFVRRCDDSNTPQCDRRLVGAI
jgi:hypothetical protein